MIFCHLFKQNTDFFQPGVLRVSEFGLDWQISIAAGCLLGDGASIILMLKLFLKKPNI